VIEKEWIFGAERNDAYKRATFTRQVFANATRMARRFARREAIDEDADDISSCAEREVAAVWQFGDWDRCRNRSLESWVTDRPAARIATRRYVGKCLSVLLSISLITRALARASRSSWKMAARCLSRRYFKSCLIYMASNTRVKYWSDFIWKWIQHRMLQTLIFLEYFLSKMHVQFFCVILFFYNFHKISQMMRISISSNVWLFK